MIRKPSCSKNQADSPKMPKRSRKFGWAWDLKKKGNDSAAVDRVEMLPNGYHQVRPGIHSQCWECLYSQAN